MSDETDLLLVGLSGKPGFSGLIHRVTLSRQLRILKVHLCLISQIPAKYSFRSVCQQHTMVEKKLSDQSPTQAAQALWLRSYDGVLSTQSLALPGFPFGSVVPFCRGPEGIPVLLLAHLAQHTKNLSANPACSLLVQERGKTDIQQLARLTCLAESELLDAPSLELQEQYFRFYPDSRIYFEELNFRFYRLNPLRFYFIGGFGAARWVDPSKIIFTRNWLDDEANFLALLQNQPQVQQTLPDSHTIVGVDPLGLDLRNLTELTRIMLKSPAKSPDEFISLLKFRAQI